MIGKEILNYTIQSHIGKGGMGSVYLAQNKYIKQQKVAIKVINASMVNDFTKSRFAAEAEKLAKLNHPNIVRFINYHIDDTGNVYLIMEYADGVSLEQYIKGVSGLIVEEKICAFFEPILDAFEYAHKNKIIHKDIKPANIIITKEGVPKILDFGIASILGEGDEDEGMIMGTPSYMSPEQVKGEHLDQRSDIYSLGVLLHQMLTGNPPYDTTTLTEHEINKKVVEENLPRMKTYYKYVSDKVQSVVDKATSKKPEARYQSCADFKKALHTAIYPPKLPVWVRYAAAVVVLLLIGGGYFLWDYNRLKVSYYKDYVEQWGLPKGIGKISGGDARHTHRMYRFESKHHKLQRVSHVNGIGTIIPENESERNDRPIDMLFFYNDDNRLSRTKVMDQNGQVLYVKSYNEKLNTVIFQFDDEYGTEKTLGSETVGYANVFASSEQSKGKISRYLLEYDKSGYVKTLRYAGFQNVYVCDANGIYGKQYVRDAKGRVIEETYLARDGSPKATKWGLGKKVFVYDDKDNWLSSSYLTLSGEPALDAAEGTSVCEMYMDKYGNEVAQYYKTGDGRLMLPAMLGIAGVKYEYDEHGYITKQSFLGIDGKVEFSAKHGAAIVVTTCNEYGFFDSIRYLDADGKPVLTEQGNSSVKAVTDAKGNMLERWCYDLEGELVLNPEGFAGEKAEYDDHGHVVMLTYYGTDSKPVDIKDGYAGYTAEYNDIGDITRVSYFGSDLHPVCNNLGIASFVNERDIRGNVTKMSFFDESGKPTLSSEGIAGAEYVYDDNGNEIVRRFFDTEGKPTKGHLDFAEQRQSYDERGNLLSVRYYNTNGSLTLVNRLAGRDYKVDEHGNVIEDVPVGTNQKLASGWLISRSKFDDRDNLIEQAYFNAEERPASNHSNIHKYTQVFNDRNQCVETRYYNTKGELTNYGTAGYCIQRDEYNERGQVVRTAYFDKNDKPAIYVGSSDGDYSSTSTEYDVYGRVLRQFFYDKNGKPTDPKVMVPEGAVEYDKWGNMVYLASLDGHGNLIKNPKTGWSIARMEYDSHGNQLWNAYYNEKNAPAKCKDGYHKAVYAYNPAGRKVSTKYYDMELKPAIVNGYHEERAKYNDDNQLVEESYHGKSGNLVNNAWGNARLVYSYNADGSVKECKLYNASGTMVRQMQYVGGEWKAVSTWQTDVLEFSDNLPLNLGEDAQNLVWQSIRVVGSTVETVFVTPSSKYDMTHESLDFYKNYIDNITPNIKVLLGAPKSVTVKTILKDSKGRELHTARG